MENLSFDAVTNSIISEFKGFMSFEQHKTLGINILQMASQKGVKKVIVDTSELQVIPQETQNWISTTWFPEANKTGLKAMAFLVPKSVFGKMSTESVNQKAGNITIQYFENMSLAKDWIKTV